MKKKNHSRIVSVTIFAAILVPLVNVALLGSLSVITGTDVVYPEILSQAIQYIKELVNILCVFAASGCLAFSHVLGRKARAVRIICVVSVPVTYLAAAFVDMAFYGGRAFDSVYLIPMLINSGFEIARYLIVVLISLRIKKSAVRSGREFSLELFSLEGTFSRAAVFTTLTVFATLIITSLTDTISLLIEYGAPLNSGELTYLIVPYPMAIVYSVIGYFVIFLVGRSFVTVKRA